MRDPRSTPESAPDAAGWQAREVVGLYGDPDTTWGICLEIGLAAPLSPHQVAERAAALVAEYPHLGPCPSVTGASAEDWVQQRGLAAAAPYEVTGELVRLVLAEDGRRLLVAAHHGVCDGLGLVAIAGAVTGAALTSAARGIGARSSPRGFLGSSIARLAEALLRPPPRFSGSGSAAGSGLEAAGETLRTRTLTRRSAGTVELCAVLAEVFTIWNQPGTGNAGRPLFVTGASRRRPGELAPDRRTGYLRFRVDPQWERAELRSRFAALVPEPEFPETSVGGIGPRVTRVLRSRLGATAQLSNIGIVEGRGLEDIAIFPALSGPRGLAVGLATTAATTTVSLRTRIAEFSPAETDRLLELIAERL